ncbi:7950_t:CDS:2, partial [Scutellospora calospora]
KKSTKEKGDDYQADLVIELVKNGIEANLTKTYIKKDNQFIPIGDGGIDIFGKFEIMNYIMQAKYRTKIDDNEVYVSPKDIREFAAILIEQPDSTIGFFISNATFLARSKNYAANSKLNLILCNEENIVERIKETQLKLEKNSKEEIVIKDITTDEKTNTDIFEFFKRNLKMSNEEFCKTKKRKYNEIENIEDEAENIILQEELENNYHKIERELTSKKCFIDLVEEKARNKLRQKYPDILFENNRISIKKRKKSNVKKIVLTGTIGARKTIFFSFISKYFEKKGLKVFIPEEISLKIKDDLDLFYKDKEKYAFFFQDLIIDTYKKMIESIDSATDDYDIIIFDRTYFDTEEDIYLKDKDEYVLDEDEISSKYEGGLVLEPEKFDITDLDKYLNKYSELLKIPIKDLINYLNTLDILHYFKSLKDICSNILCCNVKEAKEIIEKITREENQKLITKYFEDHSIKLDNSSSSNNSEPKTELYDQLQDNFYYGDNDDKTIISIVFKYIKLKIDNNIKLTFDKQYLLVYHELKNQFETEVNNEIYHHMGINNLDIVNLEEFDNVKEEVENTITSSAYIISSFTSNKELKKYKKSDNFKYIINCEAMQQYPKLRRTYRLFNDIYSSYDINKVKHGFYEDKMVKRKLFRNKEVNYCCEGVNQSSILNIYDLDKVEELHIKHCDFCADFNYCYHISQSLHGHSFYFHCDICEKIEIHIHNIYKKCFESSYSQILRFVKETIVVK